MSRQSRLICFLTCLVFAFAAMGLSADSPAFAQTADKPLCPEPPKTVHINYAFDWPVIEQQKLAQKFQLRCGAASDLDQMLSVTVSSLKGQDITIIGSKLVVQDERGQSQISLQTEQDDGRLRTAILPIRHLKTDNRYFSFVGIEGVTVEGDELILRYVVDDTRLRGVDGDIRIMWRRDGQILPKQKKSRYRLGEDDIGTMISATVEFSDKRGVVYASKQAVASSQIAMKPTPPQINGLSIDGEPLIGKTLTARYAFYDRNPEDSEQDSRIQWLRDNYPIPGANRPEYLVVPQDLGTRISVNIIPRSQNGDEGESYIASLSRNIEDELVTLRPDILAEVNGESSDAEVFDPIIATPEPISDNISAPITLRAEEVPAPNDILISRGLKIASTSPRRFSGLVYTENTVLPQRILDEIEGRMIGQEITLETIKAALEAVNDAYKEEGYELSRAMLPEQTITDGKLTIQLVQTRIGKITFENRERLSEEFLRKNLLLDEGDYISLAELERNIRLYNSGNKSKLTTELAPGENFGETDIFVQVSEPRPVELPSINVNNHASEMSDWRSNSATFIFNNLLGREDETTMSISDTAGSSSQSLSLSLPVTRYGTNFSASFQRSNTQTVGGGAELVGYRGKSHSYSFALSHPMVFKDDYSVYVSAAYSASYSDLVQAESGDLLSKSRGRKLAISLPMSYSTGLTSLAFSPTWSLINTHTKIPPDETWVQKIDGDFSASRFLNTYLTANLKGKFLYTTTRKMLNMPGEILSVGGPSSVRAYQPSESSGYQGYFISAELRSDLANWESVTLPEAIPNIQPYIFVDHMLARSQYKKDTRADYWSGAGIGLSIPNIFNVLSFDAYIAEPLDGEVHKAEQEAYDDELIQFSINARFDFLQDRK